MRGSLRVFGRVAASQPSNAGLSSMPFRSSPEQLFIFHSNLTIDYYIVDARGRQRHVIDGGPLRNLFRREDDDIRLTPDRQVSFP